MSNSALLWLYHILVVHMLEQLVGGLEVILVLGSSVTDHNLGGIFVGHNDGCNWKATPVRVWVVGLQRFSSHTSVKHWSWPILLRIKRFIMSQLIHILIRGGIFPSSFFQGELNCNCSSVNILLDM